MTTIEIQVLCRAERERRRFLLTCLIWGTLGVGLVGIGVAPWPLVWL
jgi:hypothetical protein